MEPQTPIDVQRILDRKRERAFGGYNVESCEVQCFACRLYSVPCDMYTSCV
jgi:hypothetical protein